jgi:hypothetical protein
MQRLVKVSTRFLACAAVASAAVAAAGCGGSAATPEETWANSVCAPIVEWRDQIQTIADTVTADLKSPSLQTLPSLQSGVTQAEQATQALADSLHSVGPPPGNSAEQVQNLVAGLSASLQESIQNAKTAADQIRNAANLGEAITALGVLQAQLTGIVTQASSAVTSIETLAGDLKQGFEDANSCKTLRSG